MKKTGQKILVVDDDEVMLEGIKIALEDEGYEVLTLTDNTNVEERTLEFKPEVILIDYWMPGKDGGEITKVLKKGESTRRIPVIMISASQNAFMVARASGADDFIAKPFDLDDLMEKIGKII